MVLKKKKKKKKKKKQEALDLMAYPSESHSPSIRVKVFSIPNTLSNVHIYIVHHLLHSPDQTSSFRYS